MEFSDIEKNAEGCCKKEGVISSPLSLQRLSKVENWAKSLGVFDSVSNPFDAYKKAIEKAGQLKTAEKTELIPLYNEIMRLLGGVGIQAQKKKLMAEAEKITDKEMFSGKQYHDGLNQKIRQVFQPLIDQYPAGSKDYYTAEFAFSDSPYIDKESAQKLIDSYTANTSGLTKPVLDGLSEEEARQKELELKDMKTRLAMSTTYETVMDFANKIGTDTSSLAEAERKYEEYLESAQDNYSKAIANDLRKNVIAEFGKLVEIQNQKDPAVKEAMEQIRQAENELGYDEGQWIIDHINETSSISDDELNVLKGGVFFDKSAIAAIEKQGYARSGTFVYGKEAQEQIIEDTLSFMKFTRGKVKSVNFTQTEDRSSAFNNLTAVYGGQGVNIGSGLTKSILWHELGHLLERGPKARSISNAFLASRRTSSETKLIRDVTGIKGYANGEVAFEGNFPLNAYIARDYGNGSTEVFSMALEYFSDSRLAAKLIRRDKELADLVIAYLEDENNELSELALSLDDMAAERYRDYAKDMVAAEVPEDEHQNRFFDV